MADKQDKFYLYTKDQEGFAVMKTTKQLEIGDIIIAKREFDEICGEPMTGKQIIEPKNGFYCIEPCSEIKELQADLKRKEQECEKAKQNAQDTYDLWQALIESFNILQGEKIKLEQEYEELKAENNTYKSSIIANLDKNISKRYRELLEENDKLKQTLAEIKPILEFYANSTIGEKQEDGSYKLEFTPSDIATPFCIKFDPKPAREALRKINEVENDRT